MTDKMKPVRCGCGGEARVSSYPYGQLTKYRVKCEKCGMLYSVGKYTEAEAVEAWNRAMGATDMNVGDKERTVKVDWINGEPFCPMCGDRLEWE